MKNSFRKLAVLTAIAAALLPATAARAQLFGSAYSQPAPFYPYAARQEQPYVVQPVPGAYLVRRPLHARVRHSARCRDCGVHRSVPRHARAAARFDRPHKRADRALIEELRHRHNGKGQGRETTRIVREAPVVVVHRRVVDDPPRVIVRGDAAEDAAVDMRTVPPASEQHYAGRGLIGSGRGPRVIHAEAEITIMGPDRMSVRLYRKRHVRK